MLDFNPDTRANTKECLANPLFDSFRNASLEQSAPFKIKLFMDEEGMLDYEGTNKHGMTLETVNKMIDQEIFTFEHQ